MVTDQAIRDLAARIAAEFRPERIILFGSRAVGAAREDSDVDLLVVLPYEGSALSKSAEIIARIHPGTFAIDLLVRTPEEVAWRYEGGDPLIRDAVDQGIVLYEAAA
jgi:predicted nucleotidyltransferase